VLLLLKQYLSSEFALRATYAHPERADIVTNIFLHTYHDRVIYHLKLRKEIKRRIYAIKLRNISKNGLTEHRCKKTERIKTDKH